MTLTLEEAWIKAAVEHRKLSITYVNPETKLQYTRREVEPDTVTVQGEKVHLWGILSHIPHVGPKAFLPNAFKDIRVTEATFNPRPGSRWQEMKAVYDQQGLAHKSF
ncbi:MAG TPA: hypothetical protein VNZ52_02455 [Candidatus Thermoplasmatota archaeon]|nr:hypothetical protein [Candidatus Thermoplasmatota archaeon]